MRAGIKGMNHKKYCEVQTLLKTTKVAVWKNAVDSRSRLVEGRINPRDRTRIACGKKEDRGDRMNERREDMGWCSGLLADMRDVEMDGTIDSEPEVERENWERER